MASIDELRKTLKEKRGLVGVYLDRAPVKKFWKNHPYDTLDAYVESLGFHPAGYDWQQIDNISALEILIEIIYRDLAYSLPLMPLHEAASLAVEIIKLFKEDAQSYTNWSRFNMGRASLTNATFDRGVVYMDDEHIGLFWVAEED